MFLLDTVVLAELRKPTRHHGVVAWLTSQADARMYVSVVSLGEIERGMRMQEFRNPEFARSLGLWLERLQEFYGERVLPVTASIARCWGVLSAKLGNKGVDLLLAATALEHGLAVVTRNVRHFESTGVTLVNPWE